MMRNLWRLLLPLRMYLKDVTGLEFTPKRPFILAANHESPFDPAMFLAVLRRPISFVAGGHLFVKPNRRRFLHRLLLLRLAKAIPTGSSAVNRSLSILRSGGNVGVFPEGEIHPAFKDHRLHTGAVVLSHLAQAPILPVAIHGSAEIWPVVGSKLRPGRFRSVNIAIGQLIDPPDRRAPLTRVDYEQRTARLMEIIRRLRNHV